MIRLQTVLYLTTKICARLTLCRTPLDRPTGKAFYGLDEAKEKTCPGLSWCQRSESRARGLWTSSGHVRRASLVPGVTKQWSKDAKSLKTTTTATTCCLLHDIQEGLYYYSRSFPKIATCIKDNNYGECGISSTPSLFMAEDNSSLIDWLTSSWYEASRPLSLS